MQQDRHKHYLLLRTILARHALNVSSQSGGNEKTEKMSRGSDLSVTKDESVMGVGDDCMRKGSAACRRQVFSSAAKELKVSSS